MYRIDKKMKERNGLDDEGLPKIENDKIEQYIEYYEKLIRKKVNSNIARVREQALKNIQKRHKAHVNKSRAKNLDKRIDEIKAFYEGDIVKMDKSQKDCKENRKSVKWYQWDMVMVIPNPDYEDEENFLNGHEEEGAETGADIYKECFKKVYRENQVEMKKERDREIQLVNEI